MNTSVNQAIKPRTFNPHILHWNYRAYPPVQEELEHDMKCVEDLYLRGNQIRELPSWLMLFTRLTELHLEWNELEYIPSDICKLKNLVVLGLSNNRLKELPDSITKLTSLETLLASDNMLVTIPEEVHELKSLKLLDLARNFITVLPDLLGKCPRLEEIDLRQNRLTSLPESIIHLPRFQYFDIGQNNLLYFPIKPFSTIPTIVHEGNRHLNYLSYAMASMLHIKDDEIIDLFLHYTGPSLQKVNQFDYETLNNAMLKTTMGDTIVLPKGLTKVDNAKQPEIPALMDLCLSRLHTMSKTNVRYEKYLKSRLPKCLRTRLLNDGPSVACDVCKKYLFGNVVIRLFVPSHMLCNGDCAYHYIAVFTCHVCCTASFPGGSEFPNDLIELNWTTIETSK